mgnify:CR=1 FL=1
MFQIATLHQRLMITLHVQQSIVTMVKTFVRVFYILYIFTAKL